MNFKEPDVLKSKYVSMNENGTYEVDKDAPQEVIRAFNEYENSITVDGTVSPEPLPKVPPLNK